jgi:hypothetical protein
MCCGTNAGVHVLRNLTACSNNIHAVAIVSTYAMTSHCTSVESCHLTDAKALRNTCVRKDLPAHVTERQWQGGGTAPLVHNFSTKWDVL